MYPYLGAHTEFTGQRLWRVECGHDAIAFDKCGAFYNVSSRDRLRLPTKIQKILYTARLINSQLFIQRSIETDIYLRKAPEEQRKNRKKVRLEVEQEWREKEKTTQKNLEELSKRADEYEKKEKKEYDQFIRNAFAFIAMIAAVAVGIAWHMSRSIRIIK